MENKKCAECGKYYPATLEYFHRQSNCKFGLRPSCKKCRATYRRRYYQLNRKKLDKYNREYRQSEKGKRAFKVYYNKNKTRLCEKALVDKFGPDVIGIWKEFFKKQSGLCALCGLPEKSKRKGTKMALSIDHNHNTDKFRGLLCGKCNRAIGLLNVDSLGTLNLQKL